jgi:hypothetical protein
LLFPIFIPFSQYWSLTQQKISLISLSQHGTL